MPLPGVTIVLKGTTIGTASDVDGNFSLNIPKAGMVLQFSYVGMKNKELTVQGNGEFNIVMEYDQSDLVEGGGDRLRYGYEKRFDRSSSPF